MKAGFIEQIEAFLEGRISRDELEEKARAEGITELEQEIQWTADARLAVGAAGLRDQLKEALPLASRKATPVRRLRYLRPLLAVAASALLIAFAYWGFLRSDGNDLYAQFEYVDPGLPVLMSQSEEYELLDAMTYYGEGNYEEAARRLQNLQPAYPGNDTLTYYLAASLLYQGEAEAAAPLFSEVADSGDSEFRERAEWLLALSALQEDRQALVREHLISILANPDHPFFAEAQRLEAAIGQ